MLADRRGNIAITFALTVGAMAVVMTGMIDYSRTVSAKNHAQNLGDAAALYVAKAIFDAENDTALASLTEDEVKQQVADYLSSSMAGQNLNFSFSDVKAYHTVIDDIVTVDVDIVGQIETISMFMPQNQSFKASTQSKASLQRNNIFMDIYFAIDHSGSMSTGATIEDQKKLWTLSGNGCAFACHSDDIDRARSNKIDLRIDKAIDAIQLIADKAEAAKKEKELHDESIRFSAYWFSNRLRDSFLHEVDIAKAKTNFDTKLPARPPAHGTNFHTTFTQLSKKLPKSGVGATLEDRKTFVYVLTDGVASGGKRTHLSKGNRGVIKPETCDLIKDTGATLAIVYTKYEDYSESFKEALGTDRHTRNQTSDNKHEKNYDQWVGHFDHYIKDNTKISDSLRACASAGYFFETENPAELDRASAEFFERAVKDTESAPRVSQ